MFSNFIVIDGMDCTGKSTIAEMLMSYFEEQEIECVRTREPGGTEMAESIRHEVLSKKYEGEKASNMTRMLLMFASRNQNVDYVIKPALDAGKVVLSDRFSSSTYAYQVHDAPDQRLFDLLHSRLAIPYRPLTLIFKVDYEVYLERKTKREGYEAPDNIEQDNGKREDFERIQNKYLAYAESYQNCVVVDANGTPQQIFEQILSVLYEKGFNKTSSPA